MLTARAPRLTTTMAVVVVIVALLVLTDAAIALRLAATRFTASPSASGSASNAQPAASRHPCNHGFFVSQAAHAKKGGAYVGGVARSGLGQNGTCAAPLPAKAPAASPKPSGDR